MEALPSIERQEHFMQFHKMRFAVKYTNFDNAKAAVDNASREYQEFLKKYRTI